MGCNTENFEACRKTDFCSVDETKMAAPTQVKTAFLKADS
jgi:hypothetical protein